MERDLSVPNKMVLIICGASWAREAQTPQPWYPAQDRPNFAAMTLLSSATGKHEVVFAYTCITVEHAQCCANMKASTNVMIQ